MLRHLDTHACTSSPGLIPLDMVSKVVEEGEQGSEFKSCKLTQTSIGKRPVLSFVQHRLRSPWRSLLFCYGLYHRGTASDARGD